MVADEARDRNGCPCRNRLPLRYFQSIEDTMPLFAPLDLFALAWFLGCLLRAVQGADALVADVLAKASRKD